MKATLDELQVFRAVVDAGSITCAAEQLGQTVSGVSRALSRLEEKLDTSLLSRTTRRLALTEEGAVFLENARAILAAMDEAEEELFARRGSPAGRLRINAAGPFMLHVIVPLVSEFRALFPLIELELNTDDLVIDLLEEETDVALRIGPLQDSTLRSRPLGGSAMRVVASPAYLESKGRPRNVTSLVKDHVLLGFTQPESLNGWPLRGAHGDRLRVEPHVKASSGETLRRLALEGAGIACLSDFMTLADCKRGELVQILAKDTVEVLQPIHAVFYRNTRLSSRIGSFLDFVAARIGSAAWAAH